MKQLSFILLLNFVSLPTRLGHADSGLHIGIKGGLDAATFDHENRENRHDFTGGVAGYLQRSMFEGLSLAGQLEFQYTPRGATVVADDLKQGELHLYYVDIVAAIRPGMQLGPMSVYLLLGGGLNLLASATEESTSGSKQDATGDIHRIDLALLAGAGIGVRVPRQTLGPFHLDTVFLEARHDIGLLDISRDSSGFKNRTSSVMLGLTFAAGGSSAPTRPPVPAVK
jgi:hypothetical protein